MIDWLIDWLIMEALNIAIFGINVTAVSLHVGIANIFVFSAIWVRLHPDFTLVGLRALRRSSKFFGQEGHPSPTHWSRKVPVHLCFQSKERSAYENERRLGRERLELFRPRLRSIFLFRPSTFAFNPGPGESHPGTFWVLGQCRWIEWQV